MPENRLRAHALIPLLVGQIAVGPTGLFPVRSSFLPCLQLGAVALESLLVQVEDARIARALATIVLARPERRDRWRIVVSGKLGHARETEAIAASQAKPLQRTRHFGENGERIYIGSAAMFRRRICWVRRCRSRTRIRSAPTAGQ